MSLLVTNIQRFCLHDGPGIRTTIFLKGCSAHCPWCANPEAISERKTLYFHERKCIKTEDDCILNNSCPVIKNPNIFEIKGMENSVKKCKVGALELIGKEITDDDIITEILKDKEYYGKDGGVTFSGGEALLQANSVVSVLKQIKANNVGTAIESSLFVPQKNLEMTYPFIDYFIIDVKILDKKKAKEILGIDIDLYLNNLRFLSEIVDMKNLIWRLPIVEGYTDSEKNLADIKEASKNFGIEKMEIFSVHNLAEPKYKSTGKTFTRFNQVSDEKLYKIKGFLESKRMGVEVIKI